MRVIFQDIILNQIVISITLLIVLAFLTRWALMIHKQYLGYGLGCLVSLFSLLIYAVIIDGRSRGGFNNDLNLFHIFIAAIIGVILGVAVQYGHYKGKNSKQSASKRSIAFQVALYTTINLVLLGLVFLEGKIVQNMIGICGIAFGITMLLGMIWDLIDDDDEPEGQQQRVLPPPNMPPPRSSQQVPRPPFTNKPPLTNTPPEKKRHNPKGW